MIQISAPAVIVARPCCPALVEVVILTGAARPPRIEIEDEAGRGIADLLALPPEADEAPAVNGINAYRAAIRIPPGGTLADGRAPSALIVRALSRVPSPAGTTVSGVAEARINITRTL